MFCRDMKDMKIKSKIIKMFSEHQFEKEIEMFYNEYGEHYDIDCQFYPILQNTNVMYVALLIAKEKIEYGKK